MEIQLRNPSANDGIAINSLVRRAGTLDENSLYCNLLQASHFSDTSLVAEINRQLVGSITGYRLPNSPTTLFVWQVAVDPDYRGQGLASKLLLTLSKQLIAQGITHLETTITKNNMASRQLFTRFAERSGNRLEIQAYFDKEQHLDGQVPTEYLHRFDLSKLTNNLSNQ